VPSGGKLHLYLAAMLMVWLYDKLLARYAAPTALACCKRRPCALASQGIRSLEVNQQHVCASFQQKNSHKNPHCIKRAAHSSQNPSTSHHPCPTTPARSAPTSPAGSRSLSYSERTGGKPTNQPTPRLKTGKATQHVGQRTQILQTQPETDNGACVAVLPRCDPD
jgi:hypothetical protein